MSESLQLLTLRSCARAVRSAATLAGERQAAVALAALARAQRQYEFLQRELPAHARRLRLAREAMEHGERAVGAAAAGAELNFLLREVTAAQRAADAAIAL